MQFPIYEEWEDNEKGLSTLWRRKRTGRFTLV